MNRLNTLICFYTDPGAGSMMLQLLLGGLSGVYVYARIFRHKVRDFLSRRRNRKVQHASATRDKAAVESSRFVEEN